MKKVLVAFFAAALVSAHCFAAEFVLTPTIGYSSLAFGGVVATSSISGGPQLSSKSGPDIVKSSLNLMPIGLALGVIADNGFTFLWMNDIAPVGSGSVKKENEYVSYDLDAKLHNSIAYETSLIFGRTFKAVDEKLYINVGAGLAYGVAKIAVSKEVFGVQGYSANAWDFHFGIPIQLGAQFFFTQNIGVNLTLADNLAFGARLVNGGLGGVSESSTQLGFENVFTVKVGPMFKF